MDFVADGAGLYRQIGQMKFFDVGSPPLAYVATAAWAKITAGELRVVVAATREAPSGDVAMAEDFFTAARDVPGASVVHTMLLETSAERAEPGASPFQVHAFTDAGVHTATFRLAGPDGEPQLVPDWDDDQMQREMSAAGITAPEQADFVPSMTPDGGDYIFGLDEIVFTASGPSSNATVLAVVRFDGQVTRAVSTVDAIDNRLEGGEVFAERLAYGFDEDSGGKPYLLTLARNPSGEDYRPRVLRIDGDRYVERSAERWPLAPEARISRQTFTFLDGYEADVTFVEGADEAGEEGAIVIHATTAEMSFGYAALSEDGATLYLSRPGGTAGSDVLEAELGGAATRLAALRNLPLDPTTGAGAFPTLAIIDGDELALARWDFGDGLEILPDALAGRFTDVTQLNRPLLINGGSFFGAQYLAFRARLDGEIGIGLYPFGPAARAFSSVVCSDR